LSDIGRAPHDVMDGRYDRDGAIPCQIDGGLKCFGHPIGATGLRMAYEIYLQLLGRAGDRQTRGHSGRGPSIGLTHNLGAFPTATSPASPSSDCGRPDLTPPICL